MQVETFGLFRFTPGKIHGIFINTDHFQNFPILWSKRPATYQSDLLFIAHFSPYLPVFQQLDVENE